MAEPIKLQNDVSEKKIDESKNDKSKLFDFGDNLLLPIILILMLGNNDTDSPVFDNIKKTAKEIISLPMKLDLSPEDIGTMMKVVDTATPYMNPENLDILVNFSAFLSGMQKISAIKEYGKDMTDGPLKFNNQREKALHMLGALEQYMDETTKQNMTGFKNALNMVDKFQATTSGLSEKRKNGGSIDIRDMIQLVGPLLGNLSNSPDIQQIDSMIRMVQIMSALNEDGDVPVGEEGGAAPISTGSVSNNDDDDGAFFEFIIERYDDEDDG